MIIIMKSIFLEVLSAPGCQICKVFEEYWHSIEKDWPNVTFRKIEVITEEGQAMAQKYMILASPGIVLNSGLFSVGGFDKEKFIQKLKELSA